MELKRLSPSDPLSWTLFPVLERRVRKAIADYSPHADPDATIYEIRERWVRTPNHTAYIAMLEDGVVIGHCIAWVANHYSQPFIYIYQGIMDKPADGGQLPDFLIMLREWAIELNKVLPKPIKYVEFQSFREGRAWERYFKQAGAKATRLYHTLEVSLDIG